MSYATLISVEALQARRSQPDCVIFDCRFNLKQPGQGREQYQQGHLPGACYAHLDDDLSAPPYPGSGRHPLPDPHELAVWLGQHGVTPATQVVAYDAQGGQIAARLWWLLRWLGHRQVALLDGGLPAWQQAGLPVETAVPAMSVADPYPVDLDESAALTTLDLSEQLAGGRIRLLDARSAERFCGESEPIDPVAGHVPGARNHPFTEDLAADGLFKSSRELRDSLQQDIAPFDAEHTVCMCGSGVTACHTLLALEVAGLPGARLYPGSWSEWIADPARPIATADD